MLKLTEQDIIKNWKGDIHIPIVSICIITYNHENFIEESLNGALRQKTEFPFDIIIDDDCSSDNTSDIIKKYQQLFPRIINSNLRTKNIGAINNFTQNIQRAKGKYIALCEGDDYWTDPEKINIQMNFLEKNPDYILSGHDAFIVDEKGKYLKKSKLPDEFKKDFDGKDLISNQAWILTVSWMFRNIILQEIPKECNMIINGDTFLTSLLGHYGKSKYHTDINPSAYRIHSKGIWSLLTKQEKHDTRLNTFFWLYRYYNRIGQNNYARDYLQQYNTLVLSKIDSKLIVKELIIRIKNKIITLAQLKKKGASEKQMD